MDTEALRTGGRRPTHLGRKARMPGPRDGFSRRSMLFAATLGGVLGLAASVVPTAAQQQTGFQPGVGPICSGPLGPGPCADVHRWMGQNVPGAGLLPRDGQIVATIVQSCGGEPQCTAASWASVEVERCRNGVGVEGGCFGPNGEIMKAINRVLPQHLRPNVIIENTKDDLENGPGPGNEIFGCDGFVPRLFGSRC